MPPPPPPPRTQQTPPALNLNTLLCSEKLSELHLEQIFQIFYFVSLPLPLRNIFLTIEEYISLNPSIAWADEHPSVEG